MITYPVQNRGSLKNFGMLKCHQDSLPLTDNNFLKCLNELHLVFPDWPSCKCRSSVRPFQEKCETWNKDTQESLFPFFSGINIEEVIKMNFLGLGPCHYRKNEYITSIGFGIIYLRKTLQNISERAG